MKKAENPMSNSQPVRRSRRGQNYEYKAGDTVEVVRDEGVSVGILVRKVRHHDESQAYSSSAVKHWMISFPDESEEEEISESYISRLVVDEGSQSGTGDSTQTKSTRAHSKPQPKKKTKATTKAKLDPPSVKRKSEAGRSHTTRSKAKKNGSEAPLLDGINDRKKPSRSAARRPKVGDDETLVKIQMKTGILCLYRGPRPRAEFIRVV